MFSTAADRRMSKLAALFVVFPFKFTFFLGRRTIRHRRRHR